MAYKSRVNALGLGTSTEPSKGPVTVVMTIPVATPSDKNRPSNDPGPMTAPSAQGPNRPGTVQRR